jgi:hypothetical protein
MLDDLAMRTLELEASWWRYAATREAAVRERLDESPGEYHRRLGALLDDPEAAAYAPVLVRRLRRLRARRLEDRSGRRLAG